MDTIIYYFTGTGNSLVVARLLKDALPDSQLVPLAGMMLKGEKAVAPMNSTVGVVYPMYCGMLPNIVRRFFANSDFSKAKYLFTLITEGGTTNGNPEKVTRVACLSAGHEMDGSWWVQMPDNYIPMSNALPKEKQDQLNASAKAKISDIAGKVRSFTHEVEKEKIGGKAMRSIAGGSFMKNIHDSCQKYVVNENCVKCGTCAKVCPVNNVIMNDDGPAWGHACEGCLACLQFCPKRAIDYKTKTQKRDRYHHPEVSVGDMETQKQSIV